MRLLFVGTKAGGGGTETHFVELAGAVAQAGHEVAAVVRPDGLIEHALRARGDVRLFPAQFERASDPVATLDVGRAARRFQPDWLVGSFKREYYSIALVARLQRASVALFQHTDLPTRRLTTYVLPRICRELIVPSNFLRNHLIRRGMPAHRVKVLYNPVDTVRLRPDANRRAQMRADLGFGAEDVVIGFVGRVEPEKGAEVLARAFTKAMNAEPRVRALWVGAGKWSASLQQYVVESGHEGRHIMTGWVHDASSYYAAMDVLALPSTRSETFGRSSVEAQACGVPVLGSNLAGIPETLEPGITGMLVPPYDVDAWSDALLRMTDPSVRLAMASAAPAFVARCFSAPHIAREFIRLLESA